MSEMMVIVYASMFTLALCSALVGFAITTRRFGEAWIWGMAAMYSAASIVGAITP